MVNMLLCDIVVVEFKVQTSLFKATPSPSLKEKPLLVISELSEFNIGFMVYYCIIAHL